MPTGENAKRSANPAAVLFDFSFGASSCMTPKAPASIPLATKMIISAVAAEMSWAEDAIARNRSITLGGSMVALMFAPSEVPLEEIEETLGIRFNTGDPRSASGWRDDPCQAIIAVAGERLDGLEHDRIDVAGRRDLGFSAQLNAPIGASRYLGEGWLELFYLTRRERLEAFGFDCTKMGDVLSLPIQRDEMS